MVQQAPPEVGTVLDGYRFKGGDPAQESSWEQVAPIPAPEYGPGAQRLPNGAVVRYGPRGGMDTLVSAAQASTGDKGSALVGAEARARFMINLGPLQESQRILEGMDADGYNPSSLRNVGASALEAVPFDGGFAARVAGGGDYNAYNQAAKTFEAAILPIMSGAAVTPTEAQRMIRAALPQPGDTPEVLAQKARQRRQMINAVAQGIGEAAPYEMDAPAAQDDRAEPQPPAPTGQPAPQPGSEPSVLRVGERNESANGRSPEELRAAGYEQGEDGVWRKSFTPEELEGMGYTYDPQGQQWVMPGGGAGGSAPPPAGPQGGPESPQGGDPQSGANGFAALDSAIDKLPGILRGPAEFARRGAAFYAAAGEQVPFLDEAASGIAAGLTGTSYEDVRAANRARIEYDNETYRGERVAGGISGAAAQLPAGGAAISRLAISRAAANAPRIERLARFGVRTAQNAGAGAGGAGIYAAGAAEGGGSERIREGGNALAPGAVFGAAAPYAPRALGAAGRFADDALGNAPSRAADAVSGFTGRQAGRIGNALGVPGSQELVERSTGNALAPLANRVADRLGPDRVNALAPRAQGFRDNAIDPTMVDAGDDGFRGMVRAASSRQTPGRDAARDFADGRAESMPTRLSMQARRIVSADNRPVDDIVGELTEARGAQARTTYAEPYAQPVRIDPETAQALSGAPGRAALTRARAAAEAFNDTAAMQEIDALAAGQAQEVSAATLDRIRQAMSGRAEKLAQNPATRAVGAGVAQRAGMVDSALDNVEGLGPARDAYRQASRQIEATEMGGRFLNANPDDFQGAMRGLSPEQLQAPRAAMARNIEISARTPGAAPGVARRLYSDPELGNMGRAAMGDDMDRLSAAARAESQALRNARDVNPRAGSESSLNLQDAGGLAGVGQDAMTVMRRPLTGPLQVIANRFATRGFNDTEAQQLVKMAIDPSRTDEMIALMSQRMSRREARSQARALRYQVLATTQSGQQSPE